MATRSIILGEEFIRNSNSVFGSAPGYYRAYFKGGDGSYVPCLFTPAEISEAINRAKKNPEDTRPIIGKLFRFLYGV